MVAVFIYGIIVGVVFLIALSHVAMNFAAKRREYASAVWNEKKKKWIVRGSYLSIAAKVKTGISNDDGSVEYKL